MTPKRKVKDSLGEIEIPSGKIWGASTQRAVENFPISRLRFHPVFFEVFANIKKSCALVNAKKGLLDQKRSRAIEWACDEILTGRYRDQFPVDIFQTGSGTSTNMNFNEVISFLASQKSKIEIHPNDHVNLGQSSNDVFPSVMQLSAAWLVQTEFVPAADKLIKNLKVKSRAFQNLVKVGRTHLQDAAPLTLGQEFSGYAIQINNSLRSIKTAYESLWELPIGGTAVGTGLNTARGFGKLVAQRLSKTYQMSLKEASNHFEAQSSLDRSMQLSSRLKSFSLSLHKIANDLRWYSSGPQAGIGELVLPAVQPGSSIMPGKINPVIPESVLQVCAKVIGNDATITWAAGASQFQLNTMMPLVAYSLLESIEILSKALAIFSDRCVSQVRVNQKKMADHLEKNVMLVTSLVPLIGYDKAAEIAKHAMENDQTVLDSAKKISGISEKKLLEILDPKKMLGSNQD